jgi:hypothetical protein
MPDEMRPAGIQQPDRISTVPPRLRAALYLQLTGKSPEESFPVLKSTHVDA